jgi:Methyltransferase domain
MERSADDARDATLLAEHLNESLERLPGPPYYQILKWIHRILEPANYLEIGVHKGFSLQQARPGTPTIGIDPEPDIEEELIADVTIYELTSDEFFARYSPQDLLGGPLELAFIDGLHLFEQVLRDLINVERHSTSDTVVLLHDCLPLDEVTAGRERTTDFYSGDVWKAALVLRRLQPELEMITVRTAPTGLCLVRGLDGVARRLEEEMPEIVATYTDLGYDYYLAHRNEMPEEIPNTQDAVREWLRPAPADQS